MLRLGGNTYRQRERIIAAFEEQKSTVEIADTLKTLYHGGNGIGSITAWYAEDGIPTALNEKQESVVMSNALHTPILSAGPTSTRGLTQPRLFFR